MDGWMDDIWKLDQRENGRKEFMIHVMVEKMCCRISECITLPKCDFGKCLPPQILIFIYIPKKLSEGGKHSKSYMCGWETQRKRRIGELEEWKSGDRIEFGLADVLSKGTPILIFPKACDCEAHQDHKENVDKSSTCKTYSLEHNGRRLGHIGTCDSVTVMCHFQAEKHYILLDYSCQRAHLLYSTTRLCSIIKHKIYQNHLSSCSKDGEATKKKK